MKATRFARLRRSRGFTQRSLASRLGCDPMTVSRWERGAHRPTEPLMARLARALKVSRQAMRAAFQVNGRPGGNR